MADRNHEEAGMKRVKNLEEADLDSWWNTHNSCVGGIKISNEGGAEAALIPCFTVAEVQP